MRVKMKVGYGKTWVLMAVGRIKINSSRDYISSF